MTARDEGVIKFQCRWNSQGLEPERVPPGLIDFRQRLFKKGLIGVYPDGIGFGNVSMRLAGSGGFWITGSQTGHVAEAKAEHFSEVLAFSIEENWIECRGTHKASSESLTHAMIYNTFPEAVAVIHIHEPSGWKRLQGLVPTSGREVPYGTPAMAREIERLSRETALGEMRILAMAGHEDGIISFGRSLAEAWEPLAAHSL